MSNVAIGVQPRSHDRIEIVQVLRGFAACAVVLFHVRASVQPPMDPLSLQQWLFAFGGCGVDLFFCLSGFVMAYTTIGRVHRGPLDFFIRRLCRIAPAYYSISLAFLAIMYLIEWKLGYHSPYIPDYRFTHMDVARSFLFYPMKLSEPPMFGGPVLHVGWTLNYEMYFYFVFAVSMLFGAWRWVAFFVWFALTVFLLPLAVRGRTGIDAYIFYNWHLPYINLITSPLNLEFVIGVVIGMLYIAHLGSRSAMLPPVVRLVVVSFFCWIMAHNFNQGFGLRHWGMYTTLLFAVFMLTGRAAGTRYPAFLLWLGDISFSLYLVGPIVTEGVYLVLLHFHDYLPPLSGIAYSFFVLSLCVCLAWPVNRLIEKRLSNALYRFLAARLKLGCETPPSDHPKAA